MTRHHASDAPRRRRLGIEQEKTMGSFSPMHWMIVLAVILLLFGSGRVSSLMGDLALGIKSFRKTMADDRATDVITPPEPASPALPGALATADHRELA
jgi:sec-independent protein translocase protein TatA